MPSTNTNLPLTPVLQEIAAYLQQLKTALTQEYQALTATITADLQQIAREKVILMDHLEDLNKERRDILSQAGLNLETTGISQYLGHIKKSTASQIAGLWQSIATLTRECEKQNSINGIIIESNQHHARTALAILKGQSLDTELYSDKGISISFQKGKTSIRA